MFFFLAKKKKKKKKKKRQREKREKKIRRSARVRHYHIKKIIQRGLTLCATLQGKTPKAQN